MGVVTFIFPFDSVGDDNYYFAKFYLCKKELNPAFNLKRHYYQGTAKKSIFIAYFSSRLWTPLDVKRKCNIGHVQPICVNPIKEGFERDVRATLALLLPFYKKWQP